MLIVKEKNRFYMIESAYAYSDYGYTDQAVVPENMPIFKATQSRVLVGGDCLPDLDAIRYLHFPFPAELAVPGLLHKVLPQLRAVLEGLGRLDEEGEIISNIIFAARDKAFALVSNYAVREIEKEESVGWQEDLFRYALAVTAGMPFAERIQAIYQLVGKLLGIDLFPVVMMDSTTFQVQIVEEKKV